MTSKATKSVGHQQQQYEVLMNDLTVGEGDNGASSDTPRPVVPHKLPDQNAHELRHWKNLFDFTQRSPTMLLALLLGISGALACFAFTHWLSLQIFYCPPWSINCEVQSSAHWFASRLGFVQGFLSSIYGICIAFVAYATYQFTETTIWPVLAEHALTLEGIDRYLALSRGSLSSFAYVGWHARKPKHFAVVFVVGIVGLLLHATSTVVGYAYTLMPIPTIVHSNQAYGGGMGFIFSQFNPPGPMPFEASSAVALYSGWSTGQSQEVLPELREYILDRTNFSMIGNFSVPAIHARKKIHCYGHRLNITSPPKAPYWQLYTVGTASDWEFGGSLLTSRGYVLLRFTPNTLSTWVEHYRNLSSSRAVTKLVFATLNGTIENGIPNQYHHNISQACRSAHGSPCSGFSALACDIDIDLVDSQVRNGHPPQEENSQPLTGTQMTICDSLWQCAVWLGAVPSIMGPSIWGAQPMFAPTGRLPNSSFALPAAYSDMDGADSGAYWSQANMTHFVNVSSGALGIYMAQGFPNGSTVVKSEIALDRLQPARSFALLVPLAIAVLSVMAVAVLSASMHRSAWLHDVRMGWTSEILVRSSTNELKGVVDGVRAGYLDPIELEDRNLRFGIAPDGQYGLGTQGNIRLR